MGDTRRETEDTQGRFIYEETITTYTPHRVFLLYYEHLSVWAETATEEEAGLPFDSIWRVSAPIQFIAGKVQLLVPQFSGKYEPDNAYCPGPQTSRSSHCFRSKVQSNWPAICDLRDPSLSRPHTTPVWPRTQQSARPFSCHSPHSCSPPTKLDALTFFRHVKDLLTSVASDRR